MSLCVFSNVVFLQNHVRISRDFGFLGFGFEGFYCIWLKSSANHITAFYISEIHWNFVNMFFPRYFTFLPLCMMFHTKLYNYVFCYDLGECCTAVKEQRTIVCTAIHITKLSFYDTNNIVVQLLLVINVLTIWMSNGVWKWRVISDEKKIQQ